MDNDERKILDSNKSNERIVYDTLKEVCSNLEERGYNPINQIVGYILSGDLGYISNYKKSRNKIATFERSTLVEVLLKNFIS